LKYLTGQSDPFVVDLKIYKRYIITNGYLITGGNSAVGIEERKEREKRNRRRVIIKSAKKTILKHGVDGMSMDQVADLAELNKATLYLYFSNKDDLIDAIVFEGLVGLEKEFREADRQPRSGLGKVLFLMKMTFDFYKRNPVYFHALNHQERRNPDKRSSTPFSIKGDEIAGRLFRKFQESMQQGVDEGSIRTEINIQQAFILLYAHTYGVMHTIYSKEDIYKDVLNLEPDSIEKSALELMEYYLKMGDSHEN
jgi:TetR/AcrR family transcriptional regulator